MKNNCNNNKYICKCNDCKKKLINTIIALHRLQVEQGQFQLICYYTNSIKNIKNNKNLIKNTEKSVFF